MNALLIVIALSIAQPPAGQDLRWVRSDTDPTRLYLYRAATQIGAYDLAEHYYRSFDGKEWGTRTEPPLPPPCFGVAPAKIGPAPTYRLNGTPIPAQAAYDALEKGLDDDGRKLRVSIIGPAKLRQSVRSDLESDATFAEVRGQFAVRDFAPDHWAMKPGFVTTGQPTVYCQTPDGKVLHRQDDFAGGTDALVDALRQARESYDPRRDPDLRPRTIDWRRFASVAVAGLIGVILVQILRR